MRWSTVRQPSDPSGLVARYLRWTFLRALLHRGWWLVTSVYLVVDANLGAAQLVTVAVVQGIVALAAEIPAGVLADTVSRRWSLVLSHLLMGSAMLATGLVTGFAALLATQALWGLSWTFASGAEVAWLTDELDRPAEVPEVLVRAARSQLTGSVAGIVVLGGLATLTGRGSTMVLAGASMLALGLYVAAGFRERRFVPAGSQRWAAALAIVGRGTALVRSSRPILLIFAATFAVNGALDAFGRMYPLRLIGTGFPAQPLLWFTALNVLTLLAGAGALRMVAGRVHDVRMARRAYTGACLAGAAGVAAFALVADPVLGAAAVVLVTGSADPVTRTLGTIWVNQRADTGVRATVHSFLAQAEYTGEIACGAAVALVAATAGATAALCCCAGLLLTAAGLARRAG